MRATATASATSHDDYEEEARAPNGRNICSRAVVLIRTTRAFVRPAVVRHVRTVAWCVPTQFVCVDGGIYMRAQVDVCRMRCCRVFCAHVACTIGYQGTRIGVQCEITANTAATSSTVRAYFIC